VVGDVVTLSEALLTVEKVMSRTAVVTRNADSRPINVTTHVMAAIGCSLIRFEEVSITFTGLILQDSPHF